MFEHLSGEPDQPGPAVREAVQLRARRLRQRRWAVAGTSGTAVLAVVLSLILTGSGEPRASLVVDGASPTSTPTSLPLQTADPTPAPVVTSKPTPTPVESVSPPAIEPSPTAAPSCNPRDTAQCPDGKPGYGLGFGNCSNARAVDVPAAREELFDGVTATWALPRTVQGGHQLSGQIRLRSTRLDHVEFDVQPPAMSGALIFGEGGGGAIHPSEFVFAQHIDLQPGETQTIGLFVGTTSCGDTADEPEPPLRAGRYVAGAEFTFAKARAVSGSGGTPTGEPLPDATPAPTATPADRPVPASGSFAVRDQLVIT